MPGRLASEDDVHTWGADDDESRMDAALSVSTAAAAPRTSCHGDTVALFLIQNAQNDHARAMHLKLDEQLRAIPDARK